MDDVTRFSSLFAGRLDAWGTERGGCIRGRLTRGIWIGHLRGHRPIGTYGSLESGSCWWGSIDMDFDDLGLAMNMVSIYEVFGITAFIERSRSKGWHVWVFHKEPVPLALARNAGLAVLEVLEIPKMEVYPKQSSPKPGELGNYLRLPYAAKDNKKPNRKILVEGEFISLKEFLDLAEPARIVPDDYHRLAALLPEKDHKGVYAQIGQAISDELLADSIKTSAWGNQQAAKILLGEENVGMGERDTCCFTVSKLMRGIGMPYWQAVEKMEAIWHDQIEHGDFPLTQALAKVERAYR
jgi:hypothetical protein